MCYSIKKKKLEKGFGNRQIDKVTRHEVTINHKKKKGMHVVSARWAWIHCLVVDKPIYWSDSSAVIS